MAIVDPKMRLLLAPTGSVCLAFPFSAGAGLSARSILERAWLGGARGKLIDPDDVREPSKMAGEKLARAIAHVMAWFMAVGNDRLLS